MNIHAHRIDIDPTDPAVALRAAAQRLEMGNTDDARYLLERAVSIHPEEASIHSMLGNTCVLGGDLMPARRAYERAHQCDPTALEPLLNLANVHHLLGEIEAAEEKALKARTIDPTSSEAAFRLALLALNDQPRAMRLLNDILEHAPKFTPALHQRALLHLNNNNVAAALVDIDACVKHNPENADAYFLRGTLFLDHGHPEAAIIDFENAVSLGMGGYALYYNLGTALLTAERNQDAIKAFVKASECDPEQPDPYFNVGTLCLGQEDIDTAIAFFNRALSLKPDHIDALNNRGAAYKAAKLYHDALMDYQSILNYDPDNCRALYNASTVSFEIKDFPTSLSYAEQAISVAPSFVDSYLAKGRVLFETANFDEAIKNFEAAIKAVPSEPEPYLNLGHVYRIKRNFDKAISCYEAALERGSTNRYLRGDLLFTKLQTCDWSSYENEMREFEDQMRAGQSTASPFTLVCLSNNPTDQRLAAEIYVKDQFHPKTDIDPVESHPNHEKIRIGYYSADFHNHATMHLMASLFEMHDRNRFETYAFSFGPQIHDEMRQRAENAFDYFLDVSELSDKAVALASRHFEIDVAVDLKGYTTHCRPNIFAYRAAPVQINYLGFPGTMGANFIDYIVADSILIPEGEERFYTEKVLRLPNCYQVNDQNRPPLARYFSRSELGLPEDRFIFCSFNNNYKILPPILDAWADILEAVPESVFWVLADNTTAKQNLQQAFEKRGIEPSRVIFAERMGAKLHLARQTCADLFLDTFPCAAHTTASDAIYAGLPLLALSGETFASRVAASILYAVGLPDLVTKSIPDYTKRAIQLASNPEQCRQISDYLKQTVRYSPLFNTQQTTRDLEQLYFQALREKSIA